MEREGLWLLGVDPGKTGAALAVPPAGVLVGDELRPVPTVLWTWRPRQVLGEAVYEVCVLQLVLGEEEPRRRKETVKTLHDVGMLIREGMLRVTGMPSWRLRVEAPHITPKNPRTGLSIATTTGKLIGPMEGRTGPPVMLEPAEWRASVLHLPPRTPRDRAKRVSLREMPRRLPSLEKLLQAVSLLQGVERVKLDHVTDAAGIAEHGFRTPPKQEKDDADEEGRKPKRTRRSARGVRAVEGVPAGA